MSTTDEIKARLDIVNYIQQYVPLKKAGRNFKACCPFHAENTPSFVVNPDTQSWRCFGACAEGGDIFSFAMKHQGWSFKEALEQLGNQAGVEVKKISPEQKQRSDSQDKLRGLLQTAADFYHTHLMSGDTPDVHETMRYVKDKRGLTDETIKQFGIGYAPQGWQNMIEVLTDLGYKEDDIIESGMAVKNDNGRVYDRFRNRLMIPIRDDRGRVIAFGARALSPDDNPKYLNSPQTPIFDKSRTLFGLDLAKRSIRDSETAVIVEGYMDVIQAFQAGFTNVIAQMGTAMTDTQLKSIAPRYAKKIVMALDSDAAGQNATRRSLETARQTLVADYTGQLSIDIRVLQIPDAKDPDDLLREDPTLWQTAVDTALPVADFVINMEVANLPDNASLQEREAVARRILPILIASENNLYKQDNIQKLALKLRIAERDLMAWSQDQRQQETLRPAPSPRVDNNEAPPIDYDLLEPPPLFDDELDEFHTLPDFDVSVQQPNIKIVPKREDSLEQYCLRALFLNPASYYAVNRKFNELAGENEQLQNGALGDLRDRDFSQVEHQALIHCFIDAVSQHEVEVLEYVEQNLDAILIGHLEALLCDELEHLQGRVHSKFGGDFVQIWTKHQQSKTIDNHHVELLEKSLKLREQRLRREIDDLGFLQRDAQDQGDFNASIEYGGQINTLKIALNSLNAEISTLSTQLL